VISTRSLSIVLPLLVATACKQPEAPPPPPPPPPATPTATPTPPTPPAPTPTPPATPQPRVELTAPEYNLVASMAQGVFELAIRGAGEYHVNEGYPVAVELRAENGTVAKATMRRPDAAEFSQTLARFTQPVQGAGPTTVVRGSVRFGVCRAEQCGFFNREFAVSAQ
jgi:hypothetical protein